MLHTKKEPYTHTHTHIYGILNTHTHTHTHPHSHIFHTHTHVLSPTPTHPPRRMRVPYLSILRLHPLAFVTSAIRLGGRQFTRAVTGSVGVGVGGLGTSKRGKGNWWFRDLEY